MAVYARGLHEVADGVWAWLQPDGSWGWSNAGLVTGDGSSLLVDTLFDLRLTREMLDSIRVNVPGATPIGTVVNTHANGDHCYGNQLLSQAEIVASRACAEEMPRVSPAMLAAVVDAADSLGAAGRYLARIFAPFEFHGIELKPPTRTFAGELTLGVGDREVRLLEVGPAHTDGDVVAHLPAERVVFTGDILFHGGHPIMWSGPVENWIAALDRILALEAEVVVPGHGPLADNAVVAEQKAYFEWLRDEARARWEAGMSPLEAARDLDLGPYVRWGDQERVVATIAAIYRSLAGDDGGGDVMSVFSDMAARADDARAPGGT